MTALAGQALFRARTRLHARAAAVVLLAASLVAAAHAAPPPELVSYVLTPQPKTGRLLVEFRWDTGKREQSAVTVLPQWGTVQNVPALLKDLRFDGATAEPAGNSRWLLQHAPGATIVCRYEVDPGRRELTWDAPHYPVTTRSFFFGFGNTFLLTPQSGGGLPEEYEFTLQWKLPEKWQAACSLGTGTHVGALLAPSDLRNSVYFAGPLVIRTEKRDGHSVTVAMLDQFAFSADQFAELAARIVANECDFMQEKDFPPFVVTAVPIGDPVKSGDTRLSGSGLYQSFALLAAPQSELTDAFEHLFAHELFHHWNGRLLKAKQPDKLAYWFVEGFTDYYALRILYESGYWTPEVYAKWINRHLREYAANPAQHARNEDIAANYWKERNTVGEVPYQRGLLLGLRWHKLARDHGQRDGLDRLFKALVERGRHENLEVSNEAIRAAGVQTLGDWFGPEFDRFVTEAETVDVPPDALAPALQGRVKTVYAFDLGFDRERTFKQQCVRKLKAGSEAQKAGLREGDQLVGWKIHADVEEQVELQVVRDGDVRTIKYNPRGKRSEVLQFELAKPAKDGKP